MLDQATCRTCHAEIDWAITVGGKRIPVDHQPDAHGNLAVRRDETGVLRARYVPVTAAFVRPDEKRAMPHHATCPNWKDK